MKLTGRRLVEFSPKKEIPYPTTPNQMKLKSIFAKLWCALESICSEFSDSNEQYRNIFLTNENVIFFLKP